MKNSLALVFLAMLLAFSVSNAQFAEPCDPVVDNNCQVPWSNVEILPYSISPTCYVVVYYVFRYCDPFCEVQILQIETYGNGCNVFPEYFLIQESFQQICNRNIMNYRPRTSPDCYDYWLFTLPSCWITLYCSGFIGPHGSLFLVLLPCEGSACCARQFRICRLANGSASLYPLGSTQVTYDCQWSEIPDIPSWLKPYVYCQGNCLPYCDALEYERISIQEEESNLNGISSHFILGNDNVVSLTIETDVSKDLIIKVEDINGLSLNTINLNEVKESIQRDIDLTSYSSGVYFISIYEGERIVKTHKVSLTK